MPKRKTVRELEAEVAELRMKVEDLERQPTQETHVHHYWPAQPTYRAPHPWWVYAPYQTYGPNVSPAVWGGGTAQPTSGFGADINSAGGATTARLR